MVAMLLSTLIVILVTSTFLAQNSFYSDVVQRTSLQESARGATSLITSELRGVGAGGIISALPDSVVYRVPLAVGGVCAVSGSETYVLLPLGEEVVEASEVDGYAVRAAADGRWTYTPAAWGSIYHSSGGAAAQTCALAGADTTGAAADFYRLDGLSASPAIEPGDLIMLFRETELKLGLSTLDSLSTALFWGPAGGTITEFATGLSASSAFSYRRAGQTTFQDQVVGAADLANIEAIRVFAAGVAPSNRPGRDSLTFDLTATVSLRNVH